MSNSLWLSTAYPRDSFPALNQDARCDVCIVGGGLSGIANAYFLAKEGKDVILLEKNKILAGATGNSTGKLTAQHDLVYAKLLKKFGVDDTKLYYELNEEAVRFGQSIASDNELREADSILYSQSKHGTELLKYEAKAYKELGIPGDYGKYTELPIPLDATLTMKNESQIHPVRFGQRLAKMAVEAGARIYEDSDVLLMDLKKRSLTLHSRHEVQFKELVLCTHYPIEALRGLQIMKLTVDRSYIVSAEADIALRGRYIAVDLPKRSIQPQKLTEKHISYYQVKVTRRGSKAIHKSTTNDQFRCERSVWSFGHHKWLVSTRSRNGRYNSICRNYFFRFALRLFEYRVSKVGSVKLDGQCTDY